MTNNANSFNLWQALWCVPPAAVPAHELPPIQEPLESHHFYFRRQLSPAGEGEKQQLPTHNRDKKITPVKTMDVIQDSIMTARQFMRTVTV